MLPSLKQTSYRWHGTDWQSWYSLCPETEKHRGVTKRSRGRPGQSGHLLAYFMTIREPDVTEESVRKRARWGKMREHMAIRKQGPLAEFVYLEFVLPCDHACFCCWCSIGTKSQVLAVQRLQPPKSSLECLTRTVVNKATYPVILLN